MFGDSFMPVNLTVCVKKIEVNPFQDRLKQNVSNCRNFMDRECLWIFSVQKSYF